ncbi:MAG TPA: hypothetical protein VFQ42_04185 [Mycobacterium sp.]|nr:hypothetical protein [Mycobacterium sp.]
MADGGDGEIERELVESQAEVAEIATRVRLRRQRAVMAARAAGWSKYRIAKTLGVATATIDSIIAAAERGDVDRQEAPPGE